MVNSLTVLNKKLFKSFLKWNRQPVITSYPFILDPTNLEINHLLPSTVISIEGSAGVQAAIYYAFRNDKNMKTSQKNVDLAFNILRKLNDLRVALEEKQVDRQLHIIQDVNDVVKFRIGETVQHKEIGYRGVVIGWEIISFYSKDDELHPSEVYQEVELMIDLKDYQKFDQNSTPFPSKHTADSLQPVEDPQLLRISNPRMEEFFLCFDTTLQGYLPRNELRYLYPNDFKTKLLNSKKIIAESEKSFQTLQTICRNVVSAVNEFGMESSVLIGNGLEKFCSSSGDKASLPITELTKYFQSDGINLNRNVYLQVLNDIQLLSKQCVALYHPIEYHPSNSTNSSSSFKKRLLRGGKHRLMSPDDETSCDPLLNYIEEHCIAGRKKYPYYERCVQGFRLLKEYYNLIDQMLQLRFQSIGLAYLDGLHPKHETVKEVTDNIEVNPTQKKALKHVVISAINRMEEDLKKPPVTFEVGQVIRHKKFGYRGVITGYDIRPLVDTSSWDGVIGLPSGNEQPFYRVIPDEEDIERVYGYGTYRNSYYVAQENLVLLQGSNKYQVKHQALDKYFAKYDATEGRFVPFEKLKYCFPTNPQDPVAEGSPSPMDEIDTVLIELNHLLKTVFYQSRMNYSKKTGLHVDINEPTFPPMSLQDINSSMTIQIDDILFLLQHAIRFSDASDFEAIHWNTTKSHDMVEIKKLFRHGKTNAHRGNYNQAIEILRTAARIDPSFSEIKYELASIYFLTGRFAKCITMAKEAITLYPNHFDAYGLLGLALEATGDKDESIRAFRYALSMHPWASNLPTLLIRHSKEKLLPSSLNKEDISKASTSNSLSETHLNK